jgi:hypothetical protein
MATWSKKVPAFSNHLTSDLLFTLLLICHKTKLIYIVIKFTFCGNWNSSIGVTDNTWLLYECKEKSGL